MGATGGPAVGVAKRLELPLLPQAVCRRRPGRLRFQRAMHPLVGAVLLRMARLDAEIQAIHRESRGTYGAPRIHVELAARGVRLGRKRVARLMRRAGLHG